jgi:CDP-glucose 4,6-dehydratase
VELGPGSVESVELTPEFWRDKRVLLTGHTGFKGSWLSLWLQSLGANLLGYSLPPPTDPSLYVLAGVEPGMQSISGEVLDREHLRRVMGEFQPQIVFHLAAQSLVRRSYADPIGTFSTNVLGTANVLEAVRSAPAVQAVVIVTTDKCYENQGYQNNEHHKAFRESDRLGGFDPYSSSKAAAELVTAAFRQSFFSSGEGGANPGIATARAGNVVGGGDWAADRLVADVMRAAIDGGEVSIRNPHAVRPWQHVLDPLCGYLMLAERLSTDPGRFSGAWNFGPDQTEALPVSEVLYRLRELWGPSVAWPVRGNHRDHPHEAAYLSLDCTKAKLQLGWTPQWNLNVALEATVRWYKAYQAHQDVRRLAQEQIQSFQSRVTLPAISRQ